MNPFIIVKHSGGKETRHSAASGLRIPIRPGDDILALDGDGQPADVRMRSDESDLVLLFDSVGEVTLEGFYIPQETAERVTIGVKPPEDTEHEAFYEFNSQTGNLPGARTFTLMRFSNVETITFDGIASTGVATVSNFSGSGGGGPQNSESGTPQVASPNELPSGEEIVEEPSDTTPDVFRTPEETALSGNVLQNDMGTAPDGSLFEVASHSTPANGILTVAPNGNFTYTPNPNFSGTDRFTYTTQTGLIETVTITVEPVNDLPIAVDDTVATNEDVPVAVVVRTNDSDIDGDALTVISTTDGTHGSVSIHPVSGNPIYTPDAEFSGTDSFTYTISDGNGGTATATVSVSVTAVNDAPDAVDDAITSPEDSAVEVPILGNDSDADGDPLTITGFTNGANGSVAINPVTGNPVYTPNPNFSGTDSFTYTITDGNGAFDSATVTINVTPIADPPEALPDTITTNEDAPILIDVLNNDSDPDGDLLSVISVTTPSHGSVSIDPATGNPRYTPDANFFGNDSFSYTISDGNGGIDTATVTITVLPVNDPVAAVDDAILTNEDTPIVINVLSNDSDADGDPLSITATTNGTNGIVTIDPVSGNPLYTPNPNFSGTDSFTYTITDGNGSVDTATVVVNVAEINDLPVAVDDSVGTNEDVSITVPVLNNDSDPDGDPLTVTQVTNGSNGTVAIDPVTGNPVYTPNPNFNGTDSFDYTISDGRGGLATATVTINVTAINDAPTAIDDAIATNEDTAVLIPAKGNDTDPEGDTLTITSFTNPTNGFVSIDPVTGNPLYTPNANFHGNDSFTYTISDGNGGLDVASIAITVNPVNDAPVAFDDSITTQEDTPATIPVLNNDSDPEGDTLVIDSVTNGSNGLVSIDPASGNPVYTPNPNFNGSDSFTYTIRDGNGGFDTATVNVTINSVNDVPIALDDSVSTSEDNPVTIPVRTNDSDPDGDSLSVVQVTNGTNGSVSIDPVSGNPVYTPNPNFHGSDSFTYTVSDGRGGTATATVSVTIASVNDAPLAAPDSLFTNEDTPVTIPVRTNDSDPDNDPLTVSSVTQGTNGTVSIDPVSGNPVYTPNANYHGPDTFTYTISDGNGGTDTTTVTLTVNSINDVPIAQNDSATTQEDTAVTIPVLNNDSDADGDTLSIFNLSNGANGIVTIDPVSGNPIYTPNANFSGVDTFTYSVSDGNGGTDSATVTVTVGAVNDIPVAIDDSVTTNEDTAITIPVRANDSDGDNDPLTVSAITQGTNGTVAIDAGTGNPVYTPNANFHGNDSFTYTISDGNGGSATATVNVSVNSVNDVPVALDDAITTPEDTAVIIPILNNDSDADGDPLTIFNLTNGSNGIVTIDLATGNPIYTPNANFSGTDTFTYSISDGNGGTDSATVTVTVGAINDAPVAIDDSVTTDEDTAITIPVRTNDTDADNDPLTITGVTQGMNGMVTIDPVSGNPIYTPNANFNGIDTFSYTISDGNGLSDTAMVSVTVNSINDAPIANADSTTTNEDSAVTIPVLTNDTDADGDALSITNVTNATNGIVTIDPVSGNPIYAPNANFHGTDQFTYTISDGNGGVDTTTVTVTVVSINDPPVAVNDSVTTDEDTAITIPVLSNDTDGDNDSLAITAVTQGMNGVVTIDPVSGNPVYTPNPNYHGSDMFSYEISDGNGGSDMAMVMVMINSVNDVPIAVDDAVTTPEDTAVTIPILTNDSDADGDSLTIFNLSNGSNGIVTVDPVSGNPVYTPNANFSGVDTFTYSISDGNGGSDSASVTITVGAVNDVPLAVDDTITTNEDTAVTIPVRTNDSDGDGDPLTVSSVTPAMNGTVAIDPVSGNPIYTPNPDFNGTDSFAYTVEDGNGGSDTATVTVTVNSINDNPVAVDDTVTTDEDTAITIPVRVNDTDADMDSLTVTSVTQGSNGSVTIDPVSGNPIYTPNAEFSGADSFTYSINDGNGGSASATVTVTVTPISDPPNAVDDNATTNEDTPIEINILANDSDPDGDTVSLQSFSQGSNGSVAIDPVSGNPVYTPNPNFNGSDSFTYTVNDGMGNMDTATVNITVNAVPDPPIAAPDSAVTDENVPLTNIDILANDSDADGGALTIVGTPVAANGTITVNMDQTVNYTPDLNFSGTEVISYTIRDPEGNTATSQLTITVNSVNSPPVGDPDTGVVTENTSPQATGTLNATDADGDTPQFQAVTDADGDNGFGQFTIDGSGDWTYVLDEAIPAVNELRSGETLNDSYTYTVTDGNGGVDTETITITINGANDAPTSISLDSNDVDENINYNRVTQQGEQAGAVVGTLTTSDPDSTGAFTYQIIEDDPSEFNWFTIGGPQNNQIVVKNNVDLNHEIREFHNVKVRVTDPEGASYDQIIPVQVRDLNEPPFNFIVSLSGDVHGNNDEVLAAEGIEAASQPTVVEADAGGYIKLWTAFDADNTTGEGNFLMARSFHTNFGPLGDEMQVSTSELSFGSGAEAIRLPDGSYIVTYPVIDFDGSGEGLVFRRFDSDFENPGPETAVNTSTVGDQTNQEITALSDGGFAISWEDHNTGEVKARKFNADGTPASTEQTVGLGTEAKIASLDGGGYIVTWTEADFDGLGIYAQRFDTSGSPVGVPTAVNQTTQGDQSGAAVVQRLDGTLAIVWQEARDNGDYALMGRYLSSNGTFAGSPGGVGVDGAEFEIYSQTGIEMDQIHLTATSDFGFLITFHQEETAGNGDIYTWWFDTIGRPVGTDPKLSESASLEFNNSNGKTVQLTDDEYITVFQSDQIGDDGERGAGHDALSNLADLAGTSDTELVQSNNGDFTTEVAALADGSYITFWRTKGEDGDGWALRAQRFDPDGVTVGNAWTVNTDFVGDQGYPSAANLTTGGFILAFESNGDIITQRYDGYGDELGGNVTLNTTLAGIQKRPHVTALDDGGYVISWKSEGQGLVFQAFNSNGNPNGGETIAATEASIAPDTIVSSAGLENGEFALVWENAAGDISLQQFAADGTAQGAPITVNSSIGGTQSNARIVQLNGGGFVVVWESDNGEDGEGKSILGQIYDNTGNTSGMELVLSSIGNGNQYHPDLISLTDGGFMVTWESDHLDDAQPEVFAQRFTAAGLPQSAEFQVNVAAINGSEQDRHGRPAAAELVNGNVAFAWHYESADNSGMEGAKTRLFEVLPDETSVGHLLIATLTTDDIDDGDSHTFTLIDDPSGKFEVVGNQVFLKAGESFDNLVAFTQEFTMTVRVVDQGGLSLEKDITIGVFGGIDKPVNILIDDGDVNGVTNDDNEIAVADAAPPGTVVGILTAVDEDIDDTFLFEVIEDDREEYHHFEVVNGNELVVKAGADLDADIRETHHVKIRVTDSLGAVYEEIISVRINEINQTPTQLQLSPTGVSSDYVGEAEGFTNGFDTFSNQTPYAMVVALNTGGYATIYQTDDDGFRSSNTFVQRYDALGNPVGAPDSIYPQWEPTEATQLNNGNIVLASIRHNPNAFRVYDGNMNYLYTVPDYNDANMTGFTQGQGVTALTGGGFVVGMNHIINGQFDAWFRIYDENGAPVGPSTQLNQFLASDQRDPEFAPTADGGFIAAWASNGQDGDRFSIVARKYDSTGTPAGNDLVVNEFFTGHQSEVEMVTLNNGNVVIVYQTEGLDTSNLGTAARIIDPNGTFLTSEFVLNTNISGNQSRPDIISLQDGGFMVVWNDDNVSGGNSLDIVGQRFDAAGAKVGSEFVVESGLGGQYFPRIVQMSGGDIAVTWQDEAGAGVGQKIIDVNGNIVTTPDQILTDNVDSHGTDIIALSDGNFLVLWNDHDVRGQIIDNLGNAVGNDFIVNTYTTDFQHSAKAAALEDGGFVITFSTARLEFAEYDSSISPSFSRGVGVMRYDAAGLPLHEDFLVNDTLTGEQTADSIAALKGGGFVVTWTDYNNQDGSGFGVWGQLFDTDGRQVGTEFQLHTSTAGSQLLSDVTGLDDGGFFAIWRSDQGDGSGTGVFGQRFDASGNRVGGEILINQDVSFNQYEPQITTLENGNFIVVWTDDDSTEDGDQSVINGRLFGSNAAALGNDFVINTHGPGRQRFPDVTALEDGGFIVTWDSADVPTDYIEIRAQRFDASGNAVGTDWVVSQQTGNNYRPHVAQGTDGTLMFLYSNHDLEGNHDSVQVRAFSPGVLETVAAGSIVATINPTDPDHDRGETYTFTLVNDPDNLFEIAGDKLKLQAGKTLDYENETEHTVRIEVEDSAGNTYEQDLTFQVIDVAAAPIVIDLDGDGPEFSSIKEGALFDIDGDGILEKTAWSGDNDALLAYDHNGDGVITEASEISFTGYLEGAETDLEGLKAFDTNQDGFFSAEDDEWESFGLWQDLNRDGVTDEGEYQSLSEAGLRSIRLESDENAYRAANDDVLVHGETEVTWADGLVSSAADSSFDFRELVSEHDESQPFELVLNSGQTIDINDSPPKALPISIDDPNSSTAFAPEAMPSLSIEEQNTAEFGLS